MGGSLLVDASEILFSLPQLIAAESFLSRLPGNIWVFLQVALGLGFVIFVHELGHFLAAKTFGVKCEKFYVGFDFPISIGPIKLPRTLGKFQWGETEYGIGILPLGGYVKMLGQDDDPRNAETESQRSRVGDGPDAPLDPRSYQAKAVWQRMIIISAGVVMNVIFAVLIAATAYFVGVPYSPAVVGEAVAGSPSWAAGIRPGDQVVRVAKMSSDDNFLRYQDMAMKILVQGFKTQDAPIGLTVLRGSERIEYQVAPSNRYSDMPKVFTVGIRESNVAKLSSRSPIAPLSFLDSQNVDLKPNDRIVAVDGITLPIDERIGMPRGAELLARFHAKWDQPVELTIQRPEPSDSKNKTPAKDAKTTEVKVLLPPVPAKSLGIGFTVGKITAIQSGSPAAEQEIKVGDQIVEIEGIPITDALKLPSLVAKKNGSPIKVSIRSEGEQSPTRVVTLTSKEEVRFPAISESAGELVLPGLGIAYSVSPTVASVDPNFDKAASSVAVGDVLVQFVPEPSAEQIEAFKAKDLEVAVKSHEIDRLRTIPTVHAAFQSYPEGINIRCYFQRGSQTREVVLPLNYARDWFGYQRGILLTPLEEIRQTDSLATALSLGYQETVRRLSEVFEFLQVLVTGRAPARGLAGPIGIISQATSEAAESPSRLLIFLTLLSANLAILNLLPIPALDGGHLMFLIAEAVRGKRVNEELQVRLTIVGVLCLLLLMGFVMIMDLMRFIPFGN